jgi:fatty acid desaturase
MKERNGDLKLVLFQIVSTIGTTFGYFVAAFIVILIVDIIGKLKKDNCCLMYVWLFTHVCYTLIAFLGWLGSFPACPLNVVQILEAIFASLLSGVASFLLLLEVYEYHLQLEEPWNRNTTSSEVPEVVTVEEIKDSPPSYSECFENDAPPPSYAELFPHTSQAN